MKHPLPFLFTPLLCACLGGGAAAPDMAPGPGDNPATGGTIQLAVCGYGVTTRDGASAPRPGTDQLGADPTPFAVHLGLAGDPTRTINVVWRTRDEQTLSTKVQFGEGAKLDQSLDGFTFFYETPNASPVRIHEAHLCGLKPGTQYSYRVGGVESGREVWSKTYSFHTAPDPKQGPASVLLAVLGDTRGGYSAFGQALQEIQGLGPPDLVLFSGDAVTLGTLQPDWDLYFAQAEPVLTSVPMIVAHGNHEINAVHYYSQLALPGDEEDYGLDYGAAHITVLNDSPADPADLTGRAAPFLDTDLKAAAAPWRLVMHHRAQWSASSGHGGDPMLQQLFGAVVDKYRVDLVLNGHDHDYERSKPMRGGVPQMNTADGTTFIVAGSAGADLYDNGQGAWTAKSEKTRSFLLVEVKGTSLKVRAYRDDGTPLDSLDLSKP